jgi:S-DNA-T family DNA segregation ATPase FtsK/SpoIIIE
MVTNSKQGGVGPEILGIALLGLACFLGVALYSYHPSDPSLNVQYLGKAKEIRNLGGIVGSYGADLLIQTLGVAAYLIPFGILVLALLVLLRRGVGKILIKAGSAFLMICSLSIGFGIWFKRLHIQGEAVAAGGAFGEVLSRVISRYLGPFGGSFLVILTLLLLLVIATGLSFSSLLVGLYRLMVRLSEGIKTLFTIRFEQVERKRRVGVEKKVRGNEDGERVTPVVEPPRMSVVKGVSFEQEEFEFVETKGIYHLPPVSLLDSPDTDLIKVDKESLIMNSRIVEKKLRDYGIEGKVVEVRPGPVITVFEFEPAPGVKVSRIVGLSDDLALALCAVSVRIVAPIPGKAVVGIEIPNKVRQTVYLKEVVTSEAFLESRSKLSICLGMGISGQPFVIDLAKMPHLLVAGSTGSGKSVFLNAMICSILFKSRPDEVRFLMIDPKMLELSLYEGIPHLLLPVVTNPKKAAIALGWLVDEMERRYEILAEKGVRNIDQHNRQVEKSWEVSKNRPVVHRVPDDMHKEGGVETEERPEKLPYIVVVLDELADLMMVSSRDVEDAITRLAQMARAVGIHLILATQRPSVDVITGLIKANFPARISFQVSSRTDSRTILDAIGAEHLLGAGDMLFLPPGSSKMIRVHGAFLSEIEIRRVVEFLKKQGKPEYDSSIIEEKRIRDDRPGEGEYDEKYDEAVAFVAETGQASISLIQRRFRIGYNRAARIVERMEAEGIVGPSDGVKPREVLIQKI